MEITEEKGQVPCGTWPFQPFTLRTYKALCDTAPADPPGDRSDPGVARVKRLGQGVP